MADHNRDSRISDDWSEIDDAASVLSLSSSDDFAVSQPTSPLLKPLRSPDPEVPLLPQEPERADSPSPPVKQLPESLDASTNAHKQPDLVDAPTSSFPSKDVDDALTPPPPSTSVAIAVDADGPRPWPIDREDIRNPHYYHKTLCEAIESIESTATTALELGASRISTLSFLKSTCDELAKHARELEPILGGYAQRWKETGPHADPQDIPLNPNLLEWISHLRMQLDSSQIEMARIHPQPDSSDQYPRTLKADSIPLHVNVALAGCAEALEDALTTIEDFMPIFKTDFDEALTRGMNIPSKEIGQANTTPRREPPHPDVARLRRELYSLKDQLRQINALLSLLCTPKAPDALPEGPHIIRCLERIVESVSTILTNHASEWLESGLNQSSAKTISYQEFLALEPELLHDLSGRLQQIHEDLVIDENEWESSYTAEIIRNHQIVLLAEGGLLKEIVSTAELLESLVFPEN